MCLEFRDCIPWGSLGDSSQSGLLVGCEPLNSGSPVCGGMERVPMTVISPPKTCYICTGRVGAHENSRGDLIDGYWTCPLRGVANCVVVCQDGAGLMRDTVIIRHRALLSLQICLVACHEKGNSACQPNVCLDITWYRPAIVTPRESYEVKSKESYAVR